MIVRRTLSPAVLACAVAAILLPVPGKDLTPTRAQGPPPCLATVTSTAIVQNSASYVWWQSEL